jgi:hypothetical protein
VDVTLVVPAQPRVANARVLCWEPLAGGRRRVVLATTEPLPY